MYPISHAWVVQIEVTSRCRRRCVQCTRLCHHRQPAQQWELSPDDLAAALGSCRREWTGRKIGIIGGEPTVHPQFPALCRVVRDYWTGEGAWAGLWTCGGPAYERHLAAIDRSFSWVAMNDKRGDSCLHQRLLVASRDAVPDPALRRRIQDACWVQRDWSPTICASGVWFCEVAASIARVLWPAMRGWALSEPWGTYGYAEYEAQRVACDFCGMCLPQPRDHVDSGQEVASQSWADVIGTALRAPYPTVRSDLRIDTWEQFLALAAGWRPGEYAPGRAPGGL